MPEKGEQLVQKEKELKIQIWDQHFTEKQAVVKNMGRNENEKGWVEHRTEITNQTRLEKKQGNILRGSISLGGKRAKSESN